MKERKALIGRMNSDADRSVFPENELLNCENVSHVIAADGRIAAMKPVAGTRLISYAGTTTYPFPENAKTVGSFPEEDRGRMYYFVYDPAGINHQILCYFNQENIVRLVFHSRHLEFSGTPITGIDKVGDILYWAENDKQPKKVNVERGLQTYAGQPLNQVSYIDPLGVLPDLKDITVIRPGPQYAPAFTKLATNQPYNFISDYAFQFAFRYVYRDKETSVLSPYSFIANYNSPEDDAAGLDAITVRLPTQEYIRWEVDKIQLVVRQGNIGTFFIIKQWTRSADGTAYDRHNRDGVALSYTFYNDQNGVAISEEESAKPFDNVPLSSRALAAARNRLFLGNNVFGYDINTSGKITATYTGGNTETGTQSLYATWALVTMTETLINNPTSFIERLYVRVSGSGNSSVDGYYRLESLSLEAWRFGRPYYDVDASLPGQITIDASMRVLSIADGDNDSLLQADTQTQGIYYNSGITDVETTFQIYREYSNPLPSPLDGFDVRIFGLAGTGTGTDAQFGFKSGSRYKTGIVFYDFAGRNAGVYTTETAAVRTPERTYNTAVLFPFIKVSLEMSATDIPEWAQTYQVVRTRNLTYQSFLQGYTRDAQYVGKDNDGNYKFGESATTVFSETFDSSKVQGVAINLSATTSYGLGYQYSEGDYVKLYFLNGTSARAAIVSQVGSYIVVQAKDYGTLTLNQSNIIFEIVIPRKGFLEEMFHEVGKTYAITAPGTANRALSITEVILSGDTYVKTRPYTGLGTVLVETMNPDDKHWSEWLSDIGRPNIVPYNNGRSVRQTSVCFSNTYVQSTEVNGLSSFDTLDFKDIDFTLGAIRKLILTSRTQEYGSVMLAIGEAETASMYLNENRIVDNADNVILATSGDVIGTVNPLKGSFGTVHPESVYGSEGRVFFVDATEGKVIMYSQNGLEPVSLNGMTKFFTSNLFEITGNIRTLVGVIDKRSEMYMFYLPGGYVAQTFLLDYDPIIPSPHEVSAGKVMCYLPEMQGWNTSMTFAPQWMDALSEAIVSWKDGQIYAHDANPQEGFYGTPFKCTVSFPVGNPAVFVKTLEALAIEANRPPDWVHVRNDTPFVQSTDLIATEFVSKEGIHYASFLRDRLTPGAGTYDDSLFFGEPVRGQFLQCAVRYNASPAFYMTGVTVSYDRSLGHPMLIDKG